MAKTQSGFDWMSLEESLQRLEKVNPRHAQVMELRILGGLTLEETATVTGEIPADHRQRLGLGPGVATRRPSRRVKLLKRCLTPLK